MEKQNNNCNLTTCRHNKDGKCISVENRVVCVDVSKKVLCMGECENGRKEN